MKTYEAKSQLSIIKKMMEDSRQVNINNGFSFIFWGILVSTALIINYILIKNRYSGEYIGFTWLILMGAGAIIGGIVEARLIKRVKVKTFAGDILGSLWMSIGFVIFLFVFMGLFTKAYNGAYISPLVSGLLAIGYFTSGVISRVDWLKYLSIAWYLGSWALFMNISNESMLYFAFMLIFFQAIPGIILYKKYKKDLNSELPSTI